MSFAENGRSFQSEKGNSFPTAATDCLSFQAAVADALRRDFGGAPSSVKHVAKLVNANERAVRNWFDARNGPSGEHLVMLMRHSTAVVEMVLALSGRSGLVQTKLVADAKERVRHILGLLDHLTQDDPTRP